MKTFMHAGVALLVLIADWLLGASRNREEPARASIVRFVVTHPWLTAGALITAVVIGGMLVVASGVVPIKASSGHWAITASLLDFVKVRSVATHSLGIEAPPLDDEALILRGARHFGIGCQPCHGGPGTGLPPGMAGMTPAPPDLATAVPRYSPEELFTIVRHGIKFTGMPAWPVQDRDDEVWAVVAFLRRLPGLDATEYRRLTMGDADRVSDATPNRPASGEPAQLPVVVRDVCSRCHGVEGAGRGARAFPSLAGQRAEYLHASLRAFADGRRFSGTMRVVAAGLSDEAMRDAAEYYAASAPRQAERSGDAAAIARGALIAARGVPGRDIPACAECHGPTDLPKNPAYPTLATQHSRYLASQLELLQARHRGGSSNVALMHAFVDRLSPAHIRDVTLYYGSTTARPTPAAALAAGQ